MQQASRGGLARRSSAEGAPHLPPLRRPSSRATPPRSLLLHAKHLCKAAPPLLIRGYLLAGGWWAQQGQGISRHGSPVSVSISTCSVLPCLLTARSFPLEVTTALSISGPMTGCEESQALAAQNAVLQVSLLSLNVNFLCQFACDHVLRISFYLVACMPACSRSSFVSQLASMCPTPGLCTTHAHTHAPTNT